MSERGGERRPAVRDLDDLLADAVDRALVALEGAGASRAVEVARIAICGVSRTQRPRAARTASAGRRHASRRPLVRGRARYTFGYKQRFLFVRITNATRAARLSGRAL